MTESILFSLHGSKSQDIDVLLMEGIHVLLLDATGNCNVHHDVECSVVYITCWGQITKLVITLDSLKARARHFYLWSLWDGSQFANCEMYL